MTNSDCGGELSFDRNTKRMAVEWNQDKHNKYYFTVGKALKEAGNILGGHVAINPKWSNQFSDGGLSRHPIGGCCMGNTGLNGVVNDKGQIFIGKSPTESVLLHFSFSFSSFFFIYYVLVFVFAFLFLLYLFIYFFLLFCSHIQLFCSAFTFYFTRFSFSFLCTFLHRFFPVSTYKHIF